MPSRIIIANWKMNLNRSQSLALAQAVVTNLGQVAGQIAICPSEFALAEIAKITKQSKIILGAQNLFYTANGPYTGEVSASSLFDLGCRLVLIGHSERRQFLFESDDLIAKKVAAAAKAGLLPVLCVGEVLAARQSGVGDKIIMDQVRAGLQNLTELPEQGLIIAYEPIWAIGTGESVTPEQAADTHQLIKVVLRQIFGSEADSLTRVIYGGSVNDLSAANLLPVREVDGLLVGGASLSVEQFTQICQIFLN